MRHCSRITVAIWVLGMLGIVGGFLSIAARPHAGSGFPRLGVAGLQAKERSAQGAGQNRVFYIAADEVEWNFAPSANTNPVTAMSYTDEESVYVAGGPKRIGSTYRKALYRAYTMTHSAHVSRQTLGGLTSAPSGPVIHAEVGDTIEVHFKNNTQFPQSMHPHGVRYAKDSEGAPYNDGVPASQKAGAAVEPGGTFTYHWEVPERAGPGPMDGSSVLWMYHGHVDEPGDVEAGLSGAIIVTRKGMARPDGTPNDVDREFVTLFQIFDENSSPFLDINIHEHAGLPQLVKKDDPDFQEANKKHSINGYLFANLPGLTMRHGERVRWYVMDLGSENDLHSPHWHGEAGLALGMRTDMLQLIPGGMQVFDMQADAPGTSVVPLPCKRPHPRRDAGAFHDSAVGFAVDADSRLVSITRGALWELCRQVW